MMNRRKKRKTRKNIFLRKIDKKLDDISIKMEKMKFDDYVFFMENPKKMILPNFLAGLSRGFGIAIGFTILGALVIYFLQYIITLNLPGISEFIGKIVKLVEFYINSKAK